MQRRPFYPATERNQEPIAAVLREWLPKEARQLLEIGSGSGQHAVYFSALFPQLWWQTSDLKSNHNGILAWLQSAHLDNVLPPLELNVSHRPWPVRAMDVVYASNCAHIMSWLEVTQLLAGAAESLCNAGQLILYGPFRFQTLPTAPSNTAFDIQLKQHNPLMGVRDFETIDSEATALGFRFAAMRPMPANNFMLAWQLIRHSDPQHGGSAAAK